MQRIQPYTLIASQALAESSNRPIIGWSFALALALALGGREMMKVRLGLVFLGTFLGVCGCSLFDNKSDQSANINMSDLFKGAVRVPEAPMALSGSLIPSASCEDATSYVQELLIDQMRISYQSQLDNFDNRNQQDYASPTADSSGAGEVAADMGSNKSAAGPEDFTTTNNQVVGVEEADFVKNTGQYIYALRGNQLHITKSWPVASMESLSITTLEDRPVDMLLDEQNRLIIATRPKILANSEVQNQTYDGREAGYSFDYNSVRLLVVDVSDPAAPVISKSVLFHGEYHALRRVDNSVRLVLNSYLSYPIGVDLYSYEPDQYKLTKQQFADRLQQKFAANVEIIRAQSIQDFVSYNRTYYGNYVLADEEGKVETVAENCSNVFLPSASAQLGLTSVATLELTEGTVSQLLLLARADTVYASTKSLYLTSSYWWWWSQGPENTDANYSFIHKFDLQEPDQVSYLGSGRIPGAIKDQFSLDEFEDHLRVAVTVTKYQEQENNQTISWTQNDTYNQVLVLAESEQQLKIVGQTPELAKGEQIYSSRFAGARGFVVTFRQVDPLFAIDLSNPAEPKVLGELKIPGFSNYMQFLDDNHLLTIGMDADVVSGRTTGQKLSIFDISDMSSPKEKHTYILKSDGWLFSEAQNEHKAFTYFAARGVLGIPVSGYRDTQTDMWWQRYVSSLMVFNIDVDTGISARGEIPMHDLFKDSQQEDSWWYGYTEVRRSIFADDYVYAISNAGIRAVHLDDLETPLATVAFPCDQMCLGGGWY